MPEQMKHKTGIRRKITLIICTVALIIMTVGIALGYFWGYRLLRDTLKEGYMRTVELLSASIQRILNEEIMNLQIYMSHPARKEAVAGSNMKYAQMNEEERQRYFRQMDEGWIAATAEDPLLKEYLDSSTSARLQSLVEADASIAELIIADKFGGLVAASGKTSDFYQADEAWWQIAFNHGEGRAFFGDFEFDESSNMLGIPIAIPVKDDSEEVIGVCKAVLISERLFAPLEGVRIDETGHALLIDKHGCIIFHHEIEPMSTRLCSEDQMQNLLKNKWAILESPLFHQEKVFLSLAEVKYPLLSKNAGWLVGLTQETKEVFAPLNILVLQLATVTGVLILTLVPLGVIFGGIFVRPIREIHEATEHVALGDLDYPVKIGTGDEIEQLADSFNMMTANLKKTMREEKEKSRALEDTYKQLQQKEKEIEQWSKTLEKRVEERTQELTNAQEATLNIMEDIQQTKDDLERANTELKKLDDLKSDFISTVSHELRTPLATMKEFTSIVSDEIPGRLNKEQREYVGIIKDNIDRLARLINDLLDISKIEAGRVRLKRAYAKIDDLAKGVLSNLKPEADKKQIKFKALFSPSLPSVYIDPDKIIQVFTNLIGNAIKFTPQKGKITVEVKEKKKVIECSVADTGIGIAAENLSKVFGKFQQFSRRTGAGAKGTGLGLAISKELVQMHNGKIWVESKLNKGTKFSFTLPAYTAESLFLEYVSQGIEKAKTRGRPMSLLLVTIFVGKAKKKISGGTIDHMLRDMEEIITHSLRQEEGDVVFKSADEITVILCECSRKDSSRVEARLEGVLRGYLERKKIPDEIRLLFSSATYPDDAGDAQALIEAGRRGLQAKTKEL